MTTRQEICNWFARGVHEMADYMIVVVDTFAYDDYPVYVGPDDDFWAVHARYDGVNMQRIMEVYDLRMDADPQLGEHRAYHPPAGASTT